MLWIDIVIDACMRLYFFFGNIMLLIDIAVYVFI